ncbi:hypothetical protein EVAR_8354_1 [Eumeta japonica]|uniref:Uncharacterized protein n=1 Tax=Eumeta variegata TaxID=151549 RepID=A0A4C1VCE5_EUMVA|nr:hypothetical protein EVAR_8354_1 [Eumeta japonica]
MPDPPRRRPQRTGTRHGRVTCPGPREGRPQCSIKNTDKLCLLRIINEISASAPAAGRFTTRSAVRSEPWLPFCLMRAGRPTARTRDPLEFSNIKYLCWRRGGRRANGWDVCLSKTVESGARPSFFVRPIIDFVCPSCVMHHGDNGKYLRACVLTRRAGKGPLAKFSRKLARTGAGAERGGFETRLGAFLVRDDGQVINKASFRNESD